jgi:hypothetical protein
MGRGSIAIRFGVGGHWGGRGKPHPYAGPVAHTMRSGVGASLWGARPRPATEAWGV